MTGALEITGALGDGLIVRMRIALGPLPEPFAAETWTLNVPGAPGVPEITPLWVLRVRPDGRPVAEKLEAATSVVRLKVNGTFAVADTVLALVITGAVAGGLTVIDRLTLVVPPGPVAESVKANVPVAVGV